VNLRGVSESHLRQHRDYAKHRRCRGTCQSPRGVLSFPQSTIWVPAPSLLHRELDPAFARCKSLSLPSQPMEEYLTAVPQCPSDARCDGFKLSLAKPCALPPNRNCRRNHTAGNPNQGRFTGLSCLILAPRPARQSPRVILLVLTSIAAHISNEFIQ